MKLAVNSIIEWIQREGCSGACERILWIDYASNKAVVISIYDLNALPVWKELSDIGRALSEGEVEGINADNLVNGLNVGVANTPPYRADWKGIIEQTYRRANVKSIHWLPGAVRERMRERGERDYRLDATLDRRDFVKIMIRTVLYYNLRHRMDWYSRDEFMIQESSVAGKRI